MAMKMAIEDIMSDNIIITDMEDIFQRDIPLQKLYGKTVLISGATGMLASYVVYFLIWLNEAHSANINIIALARNQQKCHARFGKYLERQYFKMRMDNILEPLSIDGDIDYIIHAASLASPQFYGTNPVDVAAPNVIGTYNLLELARQKQVKGFLYFSSGDVYGKMPDGIGEFSEQEMGTTDPLEPHSCYSESKRMGETLCASYFRQYSVPISIARIGHTYGPTMDISNDPRVFSSFMKNVCEGKDIVLRSDGTTKRPFCYIVDGVAAYLLILLRGEPGNAYNVCNTDQFISMNELAEVMVNIRKDVTLQVVHEGVVADSKFVENKDNMANCPSSAKLKKLGRECHFEVEDGFGRVYSFLKKGNE
ncbi:NAD(P)-dependent oxidoreductase [uncultured Anaerovibrio sp.]|uniref:NAD-dependent epimerase/dehydratase family protein n=1 Tax=uncultured Anaerovibrio sp. TaxID=361586 RepID=UPI00261B3B24|nr:NAD-dependent epimerase/dehydratase family protein [uncultured Anaerovibrio sp.]